MAWMILVRDIHPLINTENYTTYCDIYTYEHVPSTSKKQLYQLSSVKWSIQYVLLSAFSTCYKAVKIKNCLKSIKVSTTKIRMISVSKGSHHMHCQNQHFSLSTKMNGTQRITLVSPWRMCYMYCNVSKGISLDEATSNSEKSTSTMLVWSNVGRYCILETQYGIWKYTLVQLNNFNISEIVEVTQNDFNTPVWCSQSVSRFNQTYLFFQNLHTVALYRGS